MDLRGHRVTWLGHGTFLVDTPAGRRLLIDPWLAGNPSCPAAFREVESDAILITHGHFDHIGDARAAAGRCRGPVGCPPELATFLRGEGLDPTRLVGVGKGGTIRLDTVGASATATEAQHSSSHEGESGSITYLGEPAGFVVRFDDGPTLYVAGDTGVFGDMALIAEIYRPDVAILPIGDRYTMGPLQAAHACRLTKVPAVIPCHYGTFPALTGTPGALRAELAGLGLATEVVALEPGQSTP